MHELAVAEHLLKQVERHAKEAGAQRVVAVDLVLGDRAHLVEASLQLHFELLAAAEGSLAQGANLRFRHVSMKLRCAACGLDYQPEAAHFLCPSCQQPGALIDAGDALLIEALEVEP